MIWTHLRVIKELVFGEVLFEVEGGVAVRGLHHPVRVQHVLMVFYCPF